MGVIVVAVLTTKSAGVMRAGILILGGPWLSLIFGPVQAAIDNYLSDRRLAGDNDFLWNPQRKIAHAITARDVVLVKSMIPRAGDLNREYGEETFLHFAVEKAIEGTFTGAPVPAASIEIVRALLDAGAKADQPAAYGRWPLRPAISTSPELTEMLLKAGANPNHLDDAQRSLWWSVLSDDTDRGLRILEVLLDNGADITLRDRERGPVAWASYHARAAYSSSWRAPRMRIEGGAAWRGEQEFGVPIAAMLERDFAEREAKGNITRVMHQLRAKLAGE